MPATFFYTHLMGLRAASGLGLVGPPEAYRKHYPDLRDLVGGRLPFFEGRLPAGALTVLTKDPAAGAPVRMSIEVPAGLAGTDPGYLVASGAFPLSAVSKFTFSDQKTLEAFRSRRLSNVRSELSGTVEVDAAAFEVGRDADGQWGAGSSGGPAGPPAPEVEHAMTERRLAGASLAALAAWSKNRGSAAAIELLLRKPGDHVLSPFLSRRSRRWSAKLLQAAIATFGQLGAEVATRRAFDLIEEQARPAAKDGEAKRHLDAIGAVVRGEAPVPPQRRGGGDPMVRGVLLALLRPSPEACLRWADEPNICDEDSLAVALALTGYASGRALLDAELRPERIDLWLAQREAAAWGGDLSGAFPAPPELGIKRVDQDTETCVDLVFEDGTLAERLTRQRPLSEQLRVIDLPKAKRTALLAEIAEIMGPRYLSWTLSLEGECTLVGASDGRVELRGVGRPPIIERAADEGLLLADIDRAPDGLAIREAINAARQDQSRSLPLFEMSADA